MNENEKNICLFFDFESKDKFDYLDPSSITYDGVKQTLLDLNILKIIIKENKNGKNKRKKLTETNMKKRKLKKIDQKNT